MNRRREPEQFDPMKWADPLLPYAIGVVAGLAVGCVIAYLLRSAGLRWTTVWWGLPVGGLVCLQAPLLGIGIIGAALSALALGAYRHQEDLERGGVEAQEARDRAGTLRLITSALAVSRAREQRALDGRLAIGRTASRGVRTVPFGTSQGTRLFVPGSPGSGKSVSLASLGAAYVQQRLPVICIDPKRDITLRSTLKELAKHYDARFIEWSPAGHWVYNPVARGDLTEIADKALAGESWSEPHYLRQAQRYLGQELRAMRAVGEWPATLGTIAKYLDPDALEELAGRAEDGKCDPVFTYLEGLSPRARADLGGVRDRLAVLVESSLGHWLDPSLSPRAPQVELGQVIPSGDVVYFSLDADRYPLASQMLGAALIIDLVTLTAEMQGGLARGLVLIDEFSAIAAHQVSRLLSRSRSAGISVALATQSLADLQFGETLGTAETLTRQILSHSDAVIAHRQGDPQGAELLAEYAGTKPAWSTTRQIGGLFGSPPVPPAGTRTRVREFVAHPDEFKTLGVGEAIVIEPASGDPAELVEIWAPSAPDEEE